MSINGLMKYGALIICFSIASSIVGCASNKQRIPTDEEIAAALAQEKIKKEQEAQEAGKIAQQRQVLVDAKVNEIINSTPTRMTKNELSTFFQLGCDGMENIKDDFLRTIVEGGCKGEYESKEEYSSRLESVVDPNKVYYFDIDARLNYYDADSESYWIVVPGALNDVPTSYNAAIQKHKKYIHPKLGRFGNNTRGQFLYVPLVTQRDNEIYIGQNAFGVKSPVVSTDEIEWGLAVIYNKFIGMDSYGQKLEFSESKYIRFDRILLKIPVEEARNIKIDNKDGMLSRVGVKFSYGIGDRAKDASDNISPAVKSPIESTKWTLKLGVDLDSLCLIDKRNKKPISCRLHVE